MATQRPPRSARRVVPALGDPIRIVPLHLPRELVAPAPGIAAPPAAALTYRSGPLLDAVEVFTLFWGTAWNDPASQNIAQGLNRFFGFLVTSAYLDQLAEYGVPQHAIGHGRVTGTATVADATLGTNVTDSAIQHMLQREIASGAGGAGGAGGSGGVPAPNANSLYFVYLPPGVSVSAGGDRSCQAFCGYHDHIQTQVYYAVVPYPNCPGCLGQLGTLDALTSVSSHELAEAITDPVPGQGWYDDNHGEIGDICAWQNKKLGTYVVQLLWSNKAGACV